MSFAKTIVLTPLMLVHWGKELFCFWAILLSVRAIALFLSDGFVRYIVNEYNICSHQDPAKAKTILQSGLAFLLFFSFCISGGISLILYAWPLCSQRIFDVSFSEVQQYSLPFCLSLYLFAALIQNVQRMYAATKEAQGKVWHNLLLEIAILLLQTIALSVLLLNKATFATVVMVDSCLVLTLSLSYMLYLRKCYPMGKPAQWQAIQKGGRLFIQAGQLYASNFLEKLSSDALVLLLSFFRFDKAGIALFATVRTLINTPLLVQNLLLNTYSPEMQKAYALRDKLGLQKLLHFIRWRLGIVLLLGILFCYPLYQPVFTYWTKGTIVWQPAFMVTMLVMAVFNLYGLSFSFILKGLNLLPQMLGLMLLKALLLFLTLFIAQGQLLTLGASLAVVESIISFVCLPLILQYFWQQKKLPFQYGKTILSAVPYALVALVLLAFLLL